MATVLRCPVIAVGGSAGGVEALRAFCANLAPDLAAAVLVVLHQTATGRSELDSVLQAVTDVPVSLALHRARPQPGHIYVSTPDRHLILKEGVLQLTAGPRECHVRPAIDVLFRSVAVAMGPRCAGVVLSGLLDDGTAGLWSIKDHGGMALAQDPVEARYPSMPKSAIEHVNVDLIARADALATAVAEWAANVDAREGPWPSMVQPLHRLETEIAGGHSPGPQKLFQLAAPSRFTCPECHGVLAEIHEGSILRFRCHTGHAYSLAVLLDRLNVTVEEGLWGVMRAMEEKQMLLAWMQQNAPAGLDPRGYAATTQAVHELRALAQAHTDRVHSANEPARHDGGTGARA